MQALLRDLNIDFEENVPLGPLTWYGVGGSAQVLARPSSVQQLAALASRCHDRQAPVYVLGSGANLLVGDQGVPGVVVCLDAPFFTQMSVDEKENIVTVGAGYDLPKLVLSTARAGLAGLEVLAGIPATVGGAIRMNAGGAFGEIGPMISRVQVMDASGQVYYRDRDDLVFSYRKSNIVARYILQAEFELSPEAPEQLINRVKEIFLYKKNTQPLGDNSAGCAFKNVGELPEDVDQTLPTSAGALIERAGLKGYRVGGAHVSKKHANFISADKGASAADIMAVIEHVEQTVRDELGLTLEREVVVWP